VLQCTFLYLSRLTTEVALVGLDPFLHHREIRTQYPGHSFIIGGPPLLVGWSVKWVHSMRRVTLLVLIFVQAISLANMIISSVLFPPAPRVILPAMCVTSRLKLPLISTESGTGRQFCHRQPAMQLNVNGHCSMFDTDQRSAPVAQAGCLSP
jgi:hypothetical protein